MTSQSPLLKKYGKKLPNQKAANALQRLRETLINTPPGDTARSQFK